tara:strand:+ start:142 stop:504 length:363 start_codon:yes stop_codon:yes gene_type:complete
MDELRLLIREQIKQLMQDDALFKDREIPGVLANFDKTDGVDGEKHKSASSYMAKSQLYSIAKNVVDIFNMLEENEEISDWMESYISQAEQMIDAVHGKLQYKSSPAYQKNDMGPVLKYED